MVNLSMNATIETKAAPKAAVADTQQVNVAFLTLLQQHRSGAALSDLSDALRQVTQAVFEQGKPGTITLKLTVQPATKTAGAMVVQDDIAFKLPKPEPEGSIFFADRESWQLLRDNPNQLALSLKTVDGMASHGEALREVED
jgi:hypothetical protein